MQPYLSSSTNYTMNDQEANLVNLLRAFMAAAAELPPPPAAPNKYLMKIRDLDPKNMWDEKEDGARVPNTFFDICCKVVATSPSCVCVAIHQSFASLFFLWYAGLLPLVNDDVVCLQVLHVHGEGNVKVLYVWDGTDARPFPPGCVFSPLQYHADSHCQTQFYSCCQCRLACEGFPGLTL